MAALSITQASKLRGLNFEFSENKIKILRKSEVLLDMDNGPLQVAVHSLFDYINEKLGYVKTHTTPLPVIMQHLGYAKGERLPDSFEDDYTVAFSKEMSKYKSTTSVSVAASLLEFLTATENDAFDAITDGPGVFGFIKAQHENAVTLNGIVYKVPPSPVFSDSIIEIDNFIKVFKTSQYEVQSRSWGDDTTPPPFDPELCSAQLVTILAQGKDSLAKFIFSPLSEEKRNSLPLMSGSKRRDIGKLLPKPSAKEPMDLMDYLTIFHESLYKKFGDDVAAHTAVLLHFRCGQFTYYEGKVYVRQNTKHGK